MLHIKEPSPSRRRFASESRRVLHVLHRKQSMCHLLPAKDRQYWKSRRERVFVLTKFKCFAFLQNLYAVSVILKRWPLECPYLSAAFARICLVFRIHVRLWVWLHVVKHRGRHVESDATAGLSFYSRPATACQLVKHRR